VLLAGARLRDVVQRLAAEYDIVLVDSPPLLAVSDGLPLLAVVDGVLVVVRAGMITRSAAVRLRRTFDRVSRTTLVQLLGVVANDVADDLAPYYRSRQGRDRAASSLAREPDPTAS
jgi:Mrp family chromosome partitioning ATPase